MSTPRLPYPTLAPEATQAFIAAGAAIEKTLGAGLTELLYLRISQMNGCAYCIDMHARALLAGGEDLQRINSLVAWHEVDFYTERERAALAWVESLTDIAKSRAPAALFDALGSHFTPAEIATLSFAAALMNGWNRIAISMDQPVKKAALVG